MRPLQDVAGILLRAAKVARAHALAFGLLAAAGLAMSLALITVDSRLLHLLTDNDTRALRDVARSISFWGDFPTGSIILAAALWLSGMLFGRRHWQTAALATLLAATLAGLTASSLRVALGRPRPYAELPDGLYGPRRGHRFHAFPSGHSATSMGSAAALAVALPPTAAPAVATALAVGWSRVYLKQHHPSDVIAGFTVGALAGIALGLAARFSNRKPPP